MTRALLIALLVFLAGFPAEAACCRNPAQKVTRDAKGFGRYAVGGRGGTVYRVNTLSNCDNGTSGGIADCTGGDVSLRMCIEATGPRTCVFAVSGTIEVTYEAMRATSPYLTIAGQTSPGGIQIKRAHGWLANRGLISIQTHNVVVQYLRIRPGPGCDTFDYNEGMTLGCGTGEQGYTLGSDGIQIRSDTSSVDEPHHIYIDHVSFAWSTDESLDAWAGEHPEPSNSNARIHHVTVQDSLFSPHIDTLDSTEPTHAMATAFGGAKDVTYLRNLCVNAQFRCFKWDGYGTADVVNNVIVGASPGYSAAVSYLFRPGPGACGGVTDWAHVPPAVVNVRSNWGAHGWTPSGYSLGVLYYVICADGGLYDDGGNVVRTTDKLSQFTEGAGVGGTDSRAASEWDAGYPFRPVAISAESAKSSVLASAGASKRLDCSGTWIAARDTLDAAAVVAAGAEPPVSVVIQHPSEVGGWPDLETGAPAACADADVDGLPDAFESIYGAMTATADADSDGWTNLEEYLQGTNPAVVTY